MKKIISILLTFLLIFPSFVFPKPVQATAQASGGTYTEVSGYGIHTFTTSGTFTPETARNVEVLVVAGGGSGGGSSTIGAAAGGGGGGGIGVGVTYPASGEITVTVGVGGTGVIGVQGNPGGNSAFGTLTATGGGGGGKNSGAGANGGCGGGGGIGSGAAGTGSQGRNGGVGYSGTGTRSGAAGGGGNIGTGVNGVQDEGGAGGTGYGSTIQTGSTLYYSGGGGGGLGNTGTGSAGSGGSDVGGNGGKGAKGSNGMTNRGGGGGGSAGYAGGDGGSGVVIVKYLLLPPTAPTMGTATVLSDTSIRWNFTDNAYDETGFKVYDTNNVLKATCASTNRTYCDETGLTGNTSYTRKVVAYSNNGTSSYSSTDTASTLPTSCLPSLSQTTHNIVTNCSFSNTIKNVTDGARYLTGLLGGSSTDNTSVLTVSSGTLTINANQTVVAGSITLGGGSITIADGGIIDLDKPIWLVDKDVDGFPLNTNGYLQASAPTNGRRLNALSALTPFSASNLITDCNDNITSVTNACAWKYGDGHDGTVTISASKNINTDPLTQTRITAGKADGEAFNVSALTSTTATVTGTGTDGTAAASVGTSIAAGDEILLINLQGTSSAYGNVGNYESLTVQSVSGAIITFAATSKVNWYGSGANDTGLGTTTSDQRVILQRVPNYTNVDIQASGTLTANAWNDQIGGVIAFKADGIATISGSIDVSQKGYGTGPHGGGGPLIVLGGSGGGSFCGPGGLNGSNSPTTGSAGAAGGGGQNSASGGLGYCGGGGGSNGSGSAGNGGGGGGGAGFGGGGGGGGYGTAGVGGNNYGGNGGTNSSGNGGNGGSGGGGGGGGTYGIVDLSKLFLGSSGGGGGEASDGTTPGAGGKGGGIVYISTPTINVGSGQIKADGQVGGTGSCGTGPAGSGGGGSGGSILLKGVNITLGTGIDATGAAGGTKPCAGISYAGGASGDGRVRVEYETGYTGETNPVSSKANQ